MRFNLLILSIIILFSCNSNKNTEDVKDLYNLNIARELGICYDELTPIEGDPESFYPLCSDSTVRVFFLEPNYYLSYISSGGWCGSCGCHLTLYKKEGDKYIEIDQYNCCAIDIKQPVADYVVIKDGIKAGYCWPGWSGKFKVRNDRIYLDKIVEYNHKIMNEERHLDSCRYQDSLWLLELDDSNKILDFPSYHWEDPITLMNCDEVLAKTPEAFNFVIFEDTIIDLYQFDNRLSLKLKFNWRYENYFDIGVISIDVLKKDKVTANIDLTGIIQVEAFPYKNSKSDRHMETVREDIYMEDVNLDSYLDIKIRSSCGKSCYYSYWIFNEDSNNFEYSSSYSGVRPYYIDCNSKLLYSYDGGEAWNYRYSAYKIMGDKIKRYQSFYKEFQEDYSLEQYSDSAGNLILSDTIYKTID